MSWLSPGEHLCKINVREKSGRERERAFIVYVPASAQLSRSVPLHISFHGSNSNARIQLEFTALNNSADQHGFIVVYPYGSGVRERLLFWNGGFCCGDAHSMESDDVGFVRAMLDELYRLLPIDAERIYASGMSNGAMMAYRVANEMSDVFAAIAPVAGPMALHVEEVQPKRGMPVIHFHGDNDEFTPFTGGTGPRSVTNVEHHSIPVTIEAWATVNQCSAMKNGVATPSISELRPVVDDGTIVELHDYGIGRDGAEVLLYFIRGGGHTWPSRPPRPYYLGKSTQNLDANEVMWEFFSRHKRN
jgi:polyhydroxybutyrate depolymerase